jgi:hypothetical protein
VGADLRPGSNCGRIMSSRGPTSTTESSHASASVNADVRCALSQLKDLSWSTRRRPAPLRCPFIVNNPALSPYCAQCPFIDLALLLYSARSSCTPSPYPSTVPTRRQQPRPTLLRCPFGVNNLALPLYSARLSSKPIPVQALLS